MQLGRQQRAQEIVKAYAQRLNIPEAVVGKLATGYPDHGFVIDLREAKKLLADKIREPNPIEAKLESALAGIRGLYDPHRDPKSWVIARLNDIGIAPENTTGEEAHVEESDLRGDQEEQRAEVDGERSGNSSELHQAHVSH